MSNILSIKDKPWSGYEVHCFSGALCFILRFETENAASDCVDTLAYCKSLDSITLYERRGLELLFKGSRDGCS